MPNFILLFKATLNVLINTFKNFWSWCKEAASIAFNLLLFFGFVFGSSLLGAFLVSVLTSIELFSGIGFIVFFVISLSFSFRVINEYDRLIYKRNIDYISKD